MGSVLPNGKDFFNKNEKINEKKNKKNRKTKTVTKVAVSFTVSLGDTCAPPSPRGGGDGPHGEYNFMVHIWRLTRLLDSCVV